MSVNVELDGQVLTLLDVELFDAILAEETEHTLTGILTIILPVNSIAKFVFIC